jgi:2-amino-4-hydroxy-6-hydroxymethyldihydropteridine diphosphokinase
MRAPEWAFVALGSNLGDRAGYLAQARAELEALPETSMIAASCVEETAPLGPIPQPHYLNQMVLLRTSLTAQSLLGACHAIERRAGRVRDTRWGPRTLDLDIVRMGEQQVNEPDLHLPHPELPRRDFWQRELAELLPHVR